VLTELIFGTKKTCFIIICFLVIGQQYSKEGKRADSKAMMFDFSFFEQLAHEEFIEQFQNKLDYFVEHLNACSSQGNFLH